MKKLLLLLSFISLNFAQTAHADPINLDVVDENFNSTEKIVIDQEEIRKSRATSLPSLLETKANISVTSINTQPNSIFIRGGDSSHVLILVDGVPTYDPSTSQRTMNLFSFNLNKVKKIEILKGSQSVVYGGQALSGVIKITTVNDKTLDNENTVILEAGAARDKVNHGAVYLDTVNKIADQVHFIGNAYGIDQRTFSPAKGSDKLYPHQNYGADLGVYLKGDWSNLIKINYSNDEADQNDGNRITNLSYDTSHFEFGSKMMGASWVSKWKDVATLTATYQKSERTIFQKLSDIVYQTPPAWAAPMFPPPTEDYDYTYKGDLIDVRADATVFKNDQFNVALGGQFTQEKMHNSELSSGSFVDTNKSQQREGVYTKAGLNLSEYTLLEAGYRYETEKLDRLADSYQLGLTKNFDGSSVKIEYATGFRAPSLFQKYGGGYGNPDLKAEKSKNLSLSFDRKFTEKFYAGLALFSSYYEDLIIYVPGSPSQYKNVNKSRTSGVELTSQVGLYEDILKLNVALGYQEPRDLSANQWLLRRSLHSASARLTAKINDSNYFGLEGVYVGSKRDAAGYTNVPFPMSSVYAKVEGYALANIYYNYTLNNWNSYFARIDNITAKQYENTYGYVTKGWAAKVGTEIKF